MKIIEQNETHYNKIKTETFSCEDVEQSTEHKSNVTKNKKAYLKFVHVTDEKKTPKCTIENLLILLEYLNYTIKYNETLRSIDVFYKNKNLLDEYSLDAIIAEIKSKSVQYNLSKNTVTEYMTKIAEDNKYNPIAEWIKSKKWDKKSRLKELIDTVQTTNNELRDLFMKKWLLASVAAIFNKKNFWCKCVLVFQSKQNIAKSSWFKKLLPENMYKYLTEGFALDTDSKDSIQQASSTWLVELGELDQTLLKHPAKLKAYFTKQVDKYRPPYARNPVEFKRQSVFFASVNPSEFLKDLTGNSRYWCLALTSLNDKHNIDMQQLFAEVYELYKKNEKWWLDAEEEALVDENNKQFTIIQPLEEQVLELFDIDVMPRTRYYTATQVLRKIGYDKPTNSQAQKAGSFLKTLFEYKRDRIKGTVYLMPPEKLLSYY